MSLRLRLLVAVGLIAIVALVAADVATYSALRTFLYDRVDQSMQQSQAFFAQWAQAGGGNGCPGSASSSSSSSSSSSRSPGLPEGSDAGDAGPAPNALGTEFVQLRTPSGAVVPNSTCSAYVEDRAYAPGLPGQLPAPGGTGPTSAAYFDAPATAAGGPDFRVRVGRLENGDLLVLAVPLTSTDGTLHQLLLIELAVTGAALLVALVGGWWLVRLGLRPLAAVERTAEAIADGNLKERVAIIDEQTEVGRLGRSLNRMLERIESAFGARLASEARLRASEARLRQFVADASHELRTPVAAVSAYAELFERGASTRAEDLDRVMAGIRNETARMEHLVNDLLLLARLDEGQPLAREPVELVSLCAEAIATARAVGSEWPISLVAGQPVEVSGDPLRLRQVVDNLLANVRAHTPPGTPCTVSVAVAKGEAVLSVHDEGPGMDPEKAARVFERFYRADPSRSRTHGGSGLGLSIVAALVEAHGGRGAADARPDAGTTIVVRLPLAALREGERTHAGSPREPAVPPEPAVPAEPGSPPVRSWVGTGDRPHRGRRAAGS